MKPRHSQKIAKKTCAQCDNIPPCPPCAQHEVCQQLYPDKCYVCPRNECVNATHSVKNKAVGAIVGSLAGLALLAFVSFLVWLYVCRPSKSRKCAKRASQDAIYSFPPAETVTKENSTQMQDSQQRNFVTKGRSELDTTLQHVSSHRNLRRISEQTEPTETDFASGLGGRTETIQYPFADPVRVPVGLNKELNKRGFTPKTQASVRENDTAEPDAIQLVPTLRFAICSAQPALLRTAT